MILLRKCVKFSEAVVIWKKHLPLLDIFLRYPLGHFSSKFEAEVSTDITDFSMSRFNP